MSVRMSVRCLLSSVVFWMSPVDARRAPDQLATHLLILPYECALRILLLLPADFHQDKKLLIPENE